MICATSPSSTNFEESLNTLRYAERAKKVKNVAVINESENDKMIRELKQENEKLKGFMQALMSGDLSSINIDDPAFKAKIEEMNLGGLINKTNEERAEELNERVNDNQKAMQNMSTPFDQRVE